MESVPYTLTLRATLQLWACTCVRAHACTGVHAIQPRVLAKKITPRTRARPPTRNHVLRTFPFPLACTFAASASQVGASLTQCPHQGAKNLTNVKPALVAISKLSSRRTTGADPGAAEPDAKAAKAMRRREADTASDPGVQCRDTTRATGGLVAIAPLAISRGIIPCGRGCLTSNFIRDNPIAGRGVEPGQESAQ